MWEYETSDSAPASANLAWPNRFSRHIGDKAFGLLVADVMGLQVPKTTVLARRVAPFSFGEPTGSWRCGHAPVRSNRSLVASPPRKAG